MSSYFFTRSSVLAAVLAAAAALPAAAQPKAPQKAKLGPGLHDYGAVWDDAMRKKIEGAVRDLYGDYRCFVLIETYDGVPAQAGEVDLSDPGAVDKALNARRSELVGITDRRNCVFSLILVQSKRGRRWASNMSSPAFGKEEGEHVVHEVIHRLNTLSMPDALSYLRVAVAGKPPASTDADSAHHIGGSVFHDGAGSWTAAEREKLQRLASDIMRRYRCKVYIETRPTLPPRLTRDKDLSDHVLADHIFSSWANPRSDEVSAKDCLNINIFSCSEIHMFGVRVNWPTPGRKWTKEEQALANRLNAGLVQRLNGKFGPGMADALAYARNTLEENRALVSRAPAVSTAAASNEPHPHPDTLTAAEKTTKTLAEEELAEKGRMARAAGFESFRAAAKAGGLSSADLTAVAAVRGSVSYETLTGFVNDQIKEGRKGKDLKDDVLTFLKFLQAKK